jgi:hypothetical protein
MLEGTEERAMHDNPTAVLAFLLLITVFGIVMTVGIYGASHTYEHHRRGRRHG